MKCSSGMHVKGLRSSILASVTEGDEGGGRRGGLKEGEIKSGAYFSSVCFGSKY